MRTISRGDVFYISTTQTTGSEQCGDRPAIVVSNEKANTYSRVIEVVFLTRRSKTKLPTHIPVASFGPTSTALCEQITPVDVSRVGTYEGRITEEEMQAVNRGLLVSLGITQ